MKIFFKKIYFFLNKNDSERGFTLIETIVAVLIFGVIAVGVSGIFAQSLLLQRRGNGAQRVQENMLFALELMAREIRVSDIADQNNSACDLTELTVEHPVNGTVEYFLENAQIKRIANGITSVLTSADVTISRFRFCVIGSTVDQRPSRVTILTQASNKTSRPEDTITFDLATTVVSRDLLRDLTSQ